MLGTLKFDQIKTKIVEGAANAKLTPDLLIFSNMRGKCALELFFVITQPSVGVYSSSDGQLSLPVCLTNVERKWRERPATAVYTQPF